MKPQKVDRFHDLDRSPSRRNAIERCCVFGTPQGTTSSPPSRSCDTPGGGNVMGTGGYNDPVIGRGFGPAAPSVRANHMNPFTPAARR